MLIAELVECENWSENKSSNREEPNAEFLLSFEALGQDGSTMVSVCTIGNTFWAR